MSDRLAVGIRVRIHRIGCDGRCPLFAPGIQLRRERINRTKLAVMEPMDGQALALLPPANCCDVPPQIGSDLFPGL
jgi:hypothetical protein